jgi:PAS domain S-box-containing protein
LLEKIRALEERLWEAEQTIQAIQNGEVDALVIHKADGERLYTLTGADHGYRVLVESISEGALLLSSDDSIYYCNRALVEMLGLSIQKIIGKKLDCHVAPEARAQWTELIEESRRFGTARGEFLMQRSDGTLLPVNISLNCMRIEDFVGVCAVLTDLSEQKQVEKELIRHRTELELLVDERTVDLARSNAELQEEITGRKRMEEELRKSHDELEIRVRERTAELVQVNGELLAEIDERKRAERSVKAERQRFYDVLETLPVCVCLMTPDYHVLFANRVFREYFGESHGRRCHEYIFEQPKPCEFCESFQVLQTKQPHHWERTLPDSRIVDVYDFPFTDIDGSPLILEMKVDITERRQAEEKIKAYTARLELMNRELADFAFIASHDLQEPLRKIQTFGHMLNKRYSNALGTVGRDFMDRMIKAASRMSDLIRALLDYSRTGTSLLNYMPVSLSEVARQAASDLEFLIHEARGSVKIDEMPTVEADAALLRQLLQNMIENAIKYRKESEPPRVKIYGIAAGPVCHIFIEDNGIGFDQRYSLEIFKPFERLHGRNSPYSGTGMGLAICMKIAARHGGDITVNSTPGQGATFVVTLPIKQKKGT